MTTSRKSRSFAVPAITVAVLTLVLTAFLTFSPRVFARADGASDASFFTAEAMEQTLTEFLGTGNDTRTDRTSFTEAEAKAGDWLRVKLDGMDGLTVNKTDVKYDETHTSFNIEARFKGTDGKQQVIVGANYDNLYKDIGNIKGFGSAGALQNATGVATVLELARYLTEVKPQYPFDVVLVFFGASEPGLYGSRDYVNGMTAERRDGTLLMANVQRIGGDELYIYDNEVKTPHGNMLFDTAAAHGLSFKRQPTSVPYIASETVHGVPYTTWGMLGDQASFQSNGINCVNIFGGHLGGLSLGNAETVGNNISYTKNDNLDTLQSRYPDYSRKMADVATLLVETFEREDFAATCAASAASTYNYKWLTKPVYVSIILVGIMVIAGVVLILLVKHFEKKYPYTPTRKTLKIAVFGMEYEDPSDTDVFVDVKPHDNPFERHNNNPFDGY